jgi:hypothetical protein
MQDKINKISEYIENFTPKTFEDVESFRISLLEKRRINKIIEDFRNLNSREKNITVSVKQS